MLKISHGSQKTFTTVVGPNEHKENLDNQKAIELQNKLEAHKAEQKTVWFKLKKFWKNN